MRNKALTALLVCLICTRAMGFSLRNVIKNGNNRVAREDEDEDFCESVAAFFEAVCIFFGGNPEDCEEIGEGVEEECEEGGGGGDDDDRRRR